MFRISKAIWGAVIVAAFTSGALADDPAPQSVGIQVGGNAPAYCSLGDWFKVSGPGTFSGGPNAVIGYANSDLVGSDGKAALSSAQAVKLHAPIRCNTALTYTVKTDKGIFSRATTGTVPAGFSNYWTYILTVGLTDASGSTYVGNYLNWQSSTNWPPLNSTTARTLEDSVRSAYVEIIFTPNANSWQTPRMLAGNYSEGITFTVSPTL
jgi:hypothetical protein